MKRNPRRTLIAAALLILGAGGCTDTTELPITTITDTNYFDDPSSYRAFLAKIYAGLATSGQQGPAGNPDIKGIDEGFSQYLRLYWEAQELPTDEAVIAWGDVGLPEMNTQLWASSNPFVVAMYYRIAFQVSHGQRIPAPDHRRQAGRTECLHRSRRAHPGVPGRGAVPPGAELLARDRPVRQHPAGDRSGCDSGSPPPAQNTRQAIFDFLVSELTAIRPTCRLRRAAERTAAPPGSRGHHAAGQALPERGGLHRHPGIRSGAGGGAAA